MKKSRLTKSRRKLDAKARRIFRQLFNRPFPKDWELVWLFSGATDFRSNRIYLPDGLRGPDSYNTLVHEFVHLVMPSLNHGPLFESVVRKLAKEARKIK